MSQKIILLVVILAFLFVGYYYWRSTSVKSTNKSNEAQKNEKNYSDLSSAELASMLSQKDFKLIDVHIPEQRHIPGTDKFIPFNEIEKIIAVLPNKNERIILYCRSGGMSERVAKELVSRGYTNVYNLTGGLNKWVAEGRETLPEKSLTN